MVVNGQKLSPMAPTPSHAGSPDDGTTKKPRFEARLKIGEVNQIDVEVLAAVRAEEEKKEKVEWEKCTLFVYLR